MPRRPHGVPTVWTLALLLALLALAPLGPLSCGGAGEDAAGAADEALEEGSRLPPGISAEDLEGLNLEDTNTAGEGGSEDGTGSGAPDPRYTATLSGAQFTVLDVTRNDSNQKVIASNQREVTGDYLEIELAVENVGEEVVDLSQFSFRLESPSIVAEDYRSYYGDIGYLGEYVSEHVISAVLLDYADLSQALYKLKRKEVLDGVFLFYDLNPQSTEENTGFSADIAGGNAYLVIHKARGDDYGEEVKIGLAGLSD
ncbi:MAG: hypothetical protein AB1384_09320 [Actinomycetota bacterium]